MKTNKKGQPTKEPANQSKIILQGKLVEVAGKIVGAVVEDNEKTLLIRQAHDNESEIVLLEKAMYFEKTSITNSYWIRTINSDKPIRELPVKPLDISCDIF